MISSNDTDHEIQHSHRRGALAFYAPFHFYQPYQWGIYIRDFGIVYLASKFLGRRTLTTADNWVLRCAYEFPCSTSISIFKPSLLLAAMKF
jgi:hypothetical protein